MVKVLEKSKTYAFDVSFGRYFTHLCFKATRLSRAISGLEFFFFDLNIPGIKLNLSRSYRVFTEYDGITGQVRNCTLKGIKSELSTCYTLCSPSVFSSDDMEVVLPPVFIRVLRDLDEKETRPENLLLDVDWCIND